MKGIRDHLGVLKKDEFNSIQPSPQVPLYFFAKITRRKSKISSKMESGGRGKEEKVPHAKLSRL